MRDILFRGRQTDKEKWIYGVPVKGASADESEILIIESVFECDEYARRGCEFTPVIPSTVGQYTGLTDKNGKKIFEGDIVYCKSRLDNANMVVIFECGQFRMVLSENYHNYQTNSGFYDINCFDKEVIGNIHDNPELLKGGEE